MNPKIWTPTYIYSRIREFLFEKRHKNLPWITPDAIALLDELLTKEDVGLEFGSGRSTAWFAERIKHLTSVEDHKGWFDKVKKQFEEQGLSNVDYLLRSAEGDPLQTEYYNVMENFASESLDFIVIDGKHRDVLALRAVEKVKVGGILLLDDAQRYLPHKTRAPYSIKNNISQMEASWEAFATATSKWRLIWTSSGIADTAIFIKK